MTQREVVANEATIGPRSLGERSIDVENAILDFTRTNSTKVLRLALSLVFFWFGVLKVSGASPVNDLVRSALPLFPAKLAVVLTGTIEITIALGLLTSIAPKVTMTLFFALLVGTFSLLVTQPQLTFVNACPFHLTVTGEFIVKNVVLIAAGLTLVSSFPRRAE